MRVEWAVPDNETSCIRYAVTCISFRQIHRETLAVEFDLSLKWENKAATSASLPTLILRLQL